MIAAIVIGIQQYRDEGIGSVALARNDALGFANALQSLGCDSVNQEVLLNDLAAKTAIEAKIRNAAGSLTEQDSLYLFFVGRGFSNEGRNYLTCHDTQLSDLESTSLPLEAIFQQLRASNGPQVAMFIDATATGSNTAGLHADEFERFFEANDSHVCFTACQAGQKSWLARKHRHRAWTYHLIEAFCGEPSAAKQNGMLLTSASLQKYLVEAVPRTLRLAYAHKKEQTPCLYWSGNKPFILADLSEPILSGADHDDARGERLLRVAFKGGKSGRVRSLVGFKKSHRIPDEVNNRTEAFVGRIAADEIAEDLEQKRNALRQAFRFKRADLDVSNPGDGTGTIITPYFNYSIFVTLDDRDPSRVMWSRQVAEIKDADRILTTAFEDVFCETFDTVEFSPPSRIDVEALIDRIEEVDDDRVTLEYDQQATRCVLHVEGVRGQVHVTARAWAIVQQRPRPPKQLLDAFFQLRLALASTYGVDSLALTETE